MGAPPPSAPPRALAPLERRGLLGWLRGALGRPAPRAEVVAAPEVRLGDELAVTWRLDRGGRAITNVSVALLGHEVARRRISARTGISIVTESHPFLTLEIDRQMPPSTARSATGRGAIVVPASTVPTVAGTLNEIAWAIVVEAAHQSEAIWSGTFPIVVLPAARP